MFIDSHQHFWQVGRFSYPWMSPEVEILYQDYLPQQLAPTLVQNGVSQTVLVQASNSVAESRWLLRLADEYSFIAGVVGWVDLESPEVDLQLKELTSHPKFKGVRHLVESEPDDDWLARPSVLQGLKKLAAYGVSYDLLVHTRHLKHAATAVATCPEVSFVVDHLAKPPIAAGEIKEWAAELKPLAAFKNVSCKLSGLVTEANWVSWRISDLQPYVDYVVDIFGPDRLLFGSDHPVCLLAASYQRVLESFQEAVRSLSQSEQEGIFAGNAATFYRLQKTVSTIKQ
ncbi:MAG TPA: amidohydrolase family protein [Pyrinomonadaceae bacterium]|nr:amidohydrolase family protein [Pyrinomonadaceae bacterium]